MKLRNKKTGDIAEIDCIGLNTENQYTDFECYTTANKFNSLAELNEDWEDYTPAEPLIKDEKIRKAVRAWAEANGYFELLYDKDKDCLYSPYGSDNTDTSVSISFDNIHVFDHLEHRKLYNVAELCGEEEE